MRLPKMIPRNMGTTEQLVTMEQNSIEQSVIMKQSEKIEKNTAAVKSVIINQNGTKTLSVTLEQSSATEQNLTMEYEDTIEEDMTVKQNGTEELIIAMEQNNTTEQSVSMEQNGTNEQTVTMEQNNTTEQSVSMEQNGNQEHILTMAQNNTTEQSLSLEQNGFNEQNNTTKYNVLGEQNGTQEHILTMEQNDYSEQSVPMEQNHLRKQSVIMKQSVSMVLNETLQHVSMGPSTCTNQSLTREQSHNREQNGTTGQNVTKDHTVITAQNNTLNQCITKDQNVNIMQHDSEQSVTQDHSTELKNSTETIDVMEHNGTIQQNINIELNTNMDQSDFFEESNTTEHNVHIDTMQSVTMKQNNITEKSVKMEQSLRESDILEQNENMGQHDPIEQIEKVKKTYSCLKCASTFSIQADLDDHLKWHSLQEMKYPNPYVWLDRVNLFTCEICNKGFMENYKQEFCTTSCKPCSKILLTVQQADLDVNLEWSNIRLAWHFQNSYVKLDRVKVYTCKLCLNSFLDYNALKDHQKKYVLKKYERTSENNNHLDKPYKCDYCDWSFVMRSTLEAHSILHKPFAHACDCGVGFYKKHDLDSHRRLVHSSAPKIPTVPRFKAEIIKKTQSDSESEDKSEDDYVPSSKVGPRLKATLTYKQPKEKKTGQTSIKKSYLHMRDSSGKYNCPFCPKTYANGNTLGAHLVEHTGGGHKCDECPKVFSSESRLTQHKAWHAGVKPFSCEVCNKQFAAKTYLEIHMLVHTKEKPHQCNLCPKRFTQKGSLNLHLLRHTGKKTEACDLCSRCFYTSDELARHKRVHTGEKPFECKHCGKAFSDPSARNRHQVIHSGQKPHRCTECPQAFADSSALWRHKKLHDGYSVTCHLCPRTFRSRGSLISHLKLKHNNTGKRYECDHCGKRFTIKPYLVLHMNTHYPKLVECEICGKNISCKANLQTHIMQVHLKKFTQECEFCGHKFLHKHAMRKHVMNVHLKTQQWKYECDYCHKPTFTKEELRGHIVRKHLGLVCELCKKAFDCSQDLRRHRTIGCIRCPVCSLTFSDKSKMRNHHYLKHVPKSEQEMHGCEHCCKQFPTKHMLSKHIRTVHNKIEYSCDHCSKTEFGRVAIREHIWEKHMICLYCDVCLKRFYSDADFRQHKSRPCIVKENLRVACKICGKSTKNIRVHLLGHGPRNYKCDMCGVTYKRKRCVLRHIKSAHGF